MVSTSTKPGGRGRSRIAKSLPTVALAIGIGLLAPAAFAQHSGGGGGHGGGGGGGGGGFHGGGGGGFHGGGSGGGWHGGGGSGWHGGGGGGSGWHGGGWHGGDWHGGWHGGGWHGGGWGWGPGWGWGWGPAWGLGWGGYYPGYDPYFDDGVYSPLASAPMYAQPQDDGNQSYGPPGNYGQGNYAPGADGQFDNSRGFYRWQLGVENGSCNRPYVSQVVSNVTGNTTTAALRPGDILGGISVAPVVGGRIGPRLDVSDQACATQVLERTNTGTPVHWQTASGIPITFTVNRTDDSGGRRCRTFTATATFASKNQSVTGTACKQTDGSWQTMR